MAGRLTFRNYAFRIECLESPSLTRPNHDQTDAVIVRSHSSPTTMGRSFRCKHSNWRLCSTTNDLKSIILLSPPRLKFLQPFFCDPFHSLSKHCRLKVVARDSIKTPNESPLCAPFWNGKRGCNASISSKLLKSKVNGYLNCAESHNKPIEPNWGILIASSLLLLLNLPSLKCECHREKHKKPLQQQTKTAFDDKFCR